eukprot:SAG11_NODE_674_length_7801_cov_3.578032_9_plen_114_part_00
MGAAQVKLVPAVLISVTVRLPFSPHARPMISRMTLFSQPGGGCIGFVRWQVASSPRSSPPDSPDPEGSGDGHNSRGDEKIPRDALRRSGPHRPPHRHGPERCQRRPQLVETDL